MTGDEQSALRDVASTVLRSLPPREGFTQVYCESNVEQRSLRSSVAERNGFECRVGLGIARRAPGEPATYSVFTPSEVTTHFGIRMPVIRHELGATIPEAMRACDL